MHLLPFRRVRLPDSGLRGYLQNKETRFKLGGYPLLNAYVNIHLKRTRIFIAMYNLIQGQGEKSYFLAPHYPLNPRLLKFGLSWNFFD